LIRIPNSIIGNDNENKDVFVIMLSTNWLFYLINVCMKLPINKSYSCIDHTVR